MSNWNKIINGLPNIHVPDDENEWFEYFLFYNIYGGMKILAVYYNRLMKKTWIDSYNNGEEYTHWCRLPKPPIKK